MNADIDSPNKPEKKIPNFPIFAKMTGRDIYMTKTEETPRELRIMEMERDKYKKLTEYNFVRFPS